jgi:signal transduction histidine kinase
VAGRRDVAYRSESGRAAKRREQKLCIPLGKLPMRTAFVRRTTHVTVAGCVSLLVIACLGAWFVRGIHQLHSQVLAQQVANVVAAEELEIEMREIRNRLNRYLRTDTQVFLEQIPKLRSHTTQLLAQAQQRAESPAEEALVTQLREGYDRFFQAFQELVGQLPAEHAKRGLSDLIDNQMAQEIFVPARAMVTLHQREMLARADSGRQMANRMGLELVLLGACGAVAGALGGFGLARGLQTMLIELSLPIHGVAGQLDEVVGPVQINSHAPPATLEQTLRQIESRVASVIDHLHQSRREVQRAEQLAIVGQLAAGLAHELRNALMPVKLLVGSAVEDRRQLPPEDLAVVSHEINRLEMAVNRLLEYARPQTPEKRLFDLRLLVTEVEQLVAGRAKSQDVRLLDRLPNEPVLIDADKDQIRQVLLNILLNALDATPTGGQVTVTIARPPPGGPCAGLAGRAVQLTITDTGAGLAREIGDRLFQPFVTSKATGTGLGLSICKRIIEAHGGRIEVTNRVAGGVVVEIHLPGCAA